MTIKMKLYGKILRMRGIIRMAFLIDRLQKYESDSESLFITHLLKDTYFGMGFLARIQHFLHIPLVDRQKRTVKRRLYRALEKSKLTRKRDGYSEEFSYIAHPLEGGMVPVVDEENPILSMRVKWSNTPNKSKIYVTAQGRDFATFGGVLEEIWRERAGLVAILCSAAFLTFVAFLGKWILIHACGISFATSTCATVGL